jgi:hypothetical protein
MVMNDRSMLKKIEENHSPNRVLNDGAYEKRLIYQRRIEGRQKRLLDQSLKLMMTVIQL